MKTLTESMQDYRSVIAENWVGGRSPEEVEAMINRNKISEVSTYLGDIQHWIASKNKLNQLDLAELKSGN